MIEPAQTEWASPTVLVSKKNGFLWVLVDFWRFNAATILDIEMLPPMDVSNDSLGVDKFLTALHAL